MFLGDIKMRLKKVFLSFGMAFIILAGSITGYATENMSNTEPEIENWAGAPAITSEAGIVMDIDSGAILYAKNIDTQHYPASITKVLTALVALENSELTDIVTVKQEDVEFLEPGDSYIGLKPGEEITMEDALYGTLLASGNEAAHAVASSVEGGYDNFLKLMNEKAKELGCMNSNFTNSHGLHDDNHYTSARDMALIGSAVFKKEAFRKITATLQYTIPTTNITDVTRTIGQNHKMLYNWRSQYYEYCVGGKTGFTDQSLNTLVTFATKDDVNLVAVVLKANGNTYTYADTRTMFDYAFENFSKFSVTKEMVNDSRLKSIDKNATVMLPKDVSFEDLSCEIQIPTEKGDKTGSVIYRYNNIILGKIGMTISDAHYNELHGIKEQKEIKEKDKEKISAGSIIVRVILFLLFSLIVLFLLLLCYGMYRRKQRRKRRAEMRRRRREMEYQQYLQQMEDDK